MIGIPLGLAYSNFGEWLLHRFVLHGLGKNRRSFWSFHWHEHHRKSRRHAMVDDQYQGPLWKWSPQSKEVFGLALIAVGHLPLLRFAPLFVATVWLCEVNYYFVHRRAHLDPEWAKAHLPWHYDHHMGRDQNANWCVTFPLFDYVLGTRKRYLSAEARSAAEPSPALQPGAHAA